MSKSSNKRGVRSGGNRRGTQILLGVMIGIIVIALITLGVLYVMGERYYGSHFLKGTVVNDIDVSGMTVEELNERIRMYSLTVTERTADGSYVEEVITGDEIGLEVSSLEQVQDILRSQQKGHWITNNGKSYQLDDFVDYNSKYWEQCMGYLKCFSEDFVTSPKDAYVGEYDTENHTYTIVPEQQGNELKKKQTKQILSEAVRTLTTKVNLEDEDCYKKPKVYQDDQTLNTQVQNLNHFVNVTITYTFGDTKEIVDGDLINQWITLQDDNTILLSHDKVREYVVGLRKKYNTIFKSRKFMTSYGKEITLDKGDYGWWMDFERETKELEAMINAGESGERTPVYFQTAAQYGEKDYGDTYVEINLTAQHLFFYKDGKLELESDFVSGNTSRNHGTESGIYGITYKQRNAMLVGEDYETPVSYWMPFNNHQGLHDATWRGKFGSEIYKTGGSHGCVNLPYLVAKELYSKIEQGTPVIVYTLKGTKSDHVTEQTPEQIAQSVIDRIDEIGKVTKSSDKAIERARLLYNEINAQAKKCVTNYDTLVQAEKRLKELTGK